MQDYLIKQDYNVQKSEFDSADEYSTGEIVIRTSTYKVNLFIKEKQSVIRPPYQVGFLLRKRHCILLQLDLPSIYRTIHLLFLDMALDKTHNGWKQTGEVHENDC